jgi:hypothetical protein
MKKKLLSLFKFTSSSEKRVLFQPITNKLLLGGGLCLLAGEFFHINPLLGAIFVLAAGLLFRVCAKEAYQLDRKLCRDPICCVCLHKSMYVSKWDSYGCWSCNHWLEPACGCDEKECRFVGRPNQPF